MKDLIVKFDLNNLSWNVSEIQQEGVVLSKSYFNIEQDYETRSYDNVKYGVNITVDGVIIQHENFDEIVDITIPTKLEIKKTIPLLLQPEKVHEVIFWVEVNGDRHTYSYVTSTVTPKNPPEPILAPDYELN